MTFLRVVRDADPPREALATRSDDELMALAQTGLRSAFATLVERHGPRVVSLCGRFVNDAHQGQELAQDTWVLVWNGRDKYRPTAGFIPWLVTVARNHCRNHVRNRGVAAAHLRAVKDDAAIPVEGGEGAAQLDRILLEERRSRVRRALGELPEAMREALLLRYGEELRYDEMTSVLGAGESTLRSRVHHGLKMLQDKLEETP